MKVKKPFACPTDIRLLGKNRSQHTFANLPFFKALLFPYLCKKKCKTIFYHYLPVSLIPGNYFFIQI